MTVRIEDVKIESIVRMTETLSLLKREETYQRNRNKVEKQLYKGVRQCMQSLVEVGLGLACENAVFG